MKLPTWSRYMKLPTWSRYNWQDETLKAHAIINEGTIAAQEARLGIVNCDPLYCIADGLLRHAKAHAERYAGTIADTCLVTHDAFKDILSGLNQLNNCNGAVALELANENGYSKDSKDSGALSSMIENVCIAAGIDFNDI